MKVIRENIDITNNFSFDLINPQCTSKILNNLDTLKATQQGDLSTKLLRDINKHFKRSFFFHILFPQVLAML